MNNSFHRDKFYGPWHQTHWLWWRQTETWKRVQKCGRENKKKVSVTLTSYKTNTKSTVLSVVNGLLRIIFFSPVLNTGGGCCFLLLFSNQLSRLIPLNTFHFYRWKNCFACVTTQSQVSPPHIFLRCYTYSPSRSLPRAQTPTLQTQNP